jgi:hypothetical protein
MKSTPRALFKGVCSDCSKLLCLFLILLLLVITGIALGEMRADPRYGAKSGKIASP